MKPVYGVAFVAGIPIELSLFGAKTVDLESGPVEMINCLEVRETSFGFLQLVPKPDGDVPIPTLYVPPHYVAWMIRADDKATMGFLPAPRT